MEKQISQGHRKHAKLAKPSQGKFHRNEWSIIGAPCPRIKEIASMINEHLKAQINLIYLDDDHDQDLVKEMTFAGALQNKIKYQTHNFTDPHIAHNYPQYLNSYDAALLNGNHYTAKKQIVIINKKKEISLSKKLDRLTDVLMVIYDHGEGEVYDFLNEVSTIPKVPKFHISEIEKISQTITEDIKNNIPNLLGLVLVGGKSQRMGTDKANLVYNGTNQLDRSLRLLQVFCKDVYLSVSEANQYESDYQIADSFIGLGPYGGILSAFQKFPNHAIVTLPIDTPLVDEDFMQALVARRNPSKFATCFYNPETDFPEPLITIWEPRSYQRLLYFLAQGYSCPRKVLINSDIELVQTDTPLKMKNANTQEERNELIKMMDQS